MMRGTRWLHFGMLGGCLVVVTGCGGKFAPSPFFLADLPAALQQVCESRAELEQPPDDGRWADEKTPDYRIRTIVLNLRLADDQTAPLFAALQAEVLRLAQQNGATITNPNSNEAASMGARESSMYRYNTNTRGQGMIQLNLRQGHTTLLRDPVFKGAHSTGFAGADGFSVELSLQESPAR